MDEELLYKHWISEIGGVGWIMVNALLDTFGGAKGVYDATFKELTEVDGIGEIRAKVILNSKNNFEEKKIKWEGWYEKGINIIFADDEIYPEQFKAYPDMPYRFFYKGKLPDHGTPSISIVGARGCSPYGKAVTLKMSETFAAEGWQIISGMATGIDAYAHTGALDVSGYTCAVLGSGIDVCYPMVNFELFERIKETGCIISEFEPGTKPKREFFPFRNRLIAALADAVIVVEARKKSGSLVTADIALEQGKEVYVVPGRITDPLSMGCIGLLNEGANALTDLNDLRESCQIKRKIKTKKTKTSKAVKEAGDTNILDTNYFLLYSCLDLSPKSLEYLINVTALPEEEIFLIIAKMKLEGKIDEVAHNMFVRTSV